ncbi:hypothetical protein K0M31_013892 [Melipona bicolor]|uniref:Uncharacterized protein n=1 Tax=Melipona bicolor TaxID=60889 RepID=A0AA40KTU8_9HYME|nr:hypothetical protein K0M31_013892 [Melipona bicolor]
MTVSTAVATAAFININDPFRRCKRHRRPNKTQNNASHNVTACHSSSLARFRRHDLTSSSSNSSSSSNER